MNPTPVFSRRLFTATVMVLCVGLLAGCKTSSSAGGGAPGAQAAPAPEPPMTRARAAEICWMSTEKNSAGMNIDKRADIVTKCIADKMSSAAPKN